jgi:hypothetical protein
MANEAKTKTRVKRVIFTDMAGFLYDWTMEIRHGDGENPRRPVLTPVKTHSG